MGETDVTTELRSTVSSRSSTTESGSKEGKRTIVRVGCVVIVLLAIIDAVLLYLWFTAPPRAGSRTAGKLLGDGDDDDPYSDDEGPLLMDFADPSKSKDSRTGVWRLCSTDGCSWLEAYMGEDSAEVPAPCDDFYSHACDRHAYSVYADGRARLMEAMTNALLRPSELPDALAHGAAVGSRGELHSRHGAEVHEGDVEVLQKCLDRGLPIVSASDLDSDCEQTSAPGCPPRTPLALAEASENFFSRKRNATIRDYAAFIERLSVHASVDKTKGATKFGNRGRAPPQRPALSAPWFKRACHWVSRAARCHLRGNLGRSDANLRAYQRAWKALYFAPFMGLQAELLLGFLYRDPPAPRVHACLSIMADVFEDDAFAVAKQVLADAVDDLEGSLSQLGRDARVAMRESTRSMMAEAAGDPQYLASPRKILSQDEGDDLNVVLVDSYQASVENMTFFSSQARFGDRNRRRVFLVTPGLLGLLVNASSSVEPVLVPALAKPLLRAMLTNRQSQTISDAVPPARVLNKLTRCFTTRFNVSQSLSPEVAAELVVLEPLFQLYRKRLTESIPSDTVLHASYTNQQLFFLLWAHGHCGDPNGRVLVNTVARNYPRFGRNFRCSAAKHTAHEKSCSLSNQV